MVGSSCPWNQLESSPTTFCEENLCAWIRQPANTWSNLAFIFVGILILRRARSGTTSSHFHGLGWVAIITGVGSAFYHASESRIGAIADYFGMYLGSAYMLTTNLHRLTGWKSPVRTAVYWSVLVLTLGSMILNENTARTIYGAISIVCCLALEIAIYFRNRKNGIVISYRWFAGVWILFSLSYWVWKFDEARMACDPHNHVFTGHALWHLLNAAALYVLFLYYRQFKLGCDPTTSEVVRSSE